MSRHRSTGSKSHHIRKIETDHYRLSWVVDRYYKSSMLRHPQDYCRDTDLAGAERFAKRWGLDLETGRRFYAAASTEGE